MGQHCETPFDGIESAHEFLGLLCGCVAEAKDEIEMHTAREISNPSRRLDALRIASYKLEKLQEHLNRSGRILNDLRSLRRLLFQERTPAYKLQPAPIEEQEVPLPTTPRPRRVRARSDELIAA